MTRLVPTLLLLMTAATCAGQSPPAKQEPAQASQGENKSSRRTELNLLGETDAGAGESRRNENVQFNPIDNNALRELNIRMGASATIVGESGPTAAASESNSATCRGGRRHDALFLQGLRETAGLGHAAKHLVRVDIAFLFQPGNTKDDPIAFGGSAASAGISVQ